MKLVFIIMKEDSFRLIQFDVKSHVVKSLWNHTLISFKHIISCVFIVCQSAISIMCLIGYCLWVSTGQSHLETTRDYSRKLMSLEYESQSYDWVWLVCFTAEDHSKAIASNRETTLHPNPHPLIDILPISLLSYSPSLKQHGQSQDHLHQCENKTQCLQQER